MRPSFGAAPLLADPSFPCSSGDADVEEDEGCAEGDDGEGDDESDESLRSDTEDDSSDSSDSESDDDLDEDYSDGEEEEEEEEEEGGGVTSRKRKRKENSSGDDYDDDDDDDDAREEELFHKVVSMLQGKKDLSVLRLDECKSYLRRHSLRLTGSKTVCMQRIQDHWGLRDGNGERLYPRSSFVINCTGDVCTGDVILFKQRVYDKYDKVTRGGNVIGRRTIAGKVVKESYGAVKKQHTFTVEIIWSRGVKPLPVLYPLLVKGRNLYRLRTFRQRWENEIERSKVLAEKHKRGAAARHARAVDKAKSLKRGPKYHQSSFDKRGRSTKWSNKKEVKRKTSTRTHSHPPRCFPKQGVLQSAVNHSVHGRADRVQRDNLLRQSMPSYTYCQPSTELHHGDMRAASDANGGLLYSSAYWAGSSSTGRTDLYNQALNRTSFINYPYSNCCPPYGVNSSSQVHFVESLKFPSGMPLDRWKGVLLCRTPGCRELAVDGCVMSCCWLCCRRFGRQCDRHR